MVWRFEETLIKYGNMEKERKRYKKRRVPRRE
jgi:hypothetical protein